MSAEIDLAYYERLDGVLQKDVEVLVHVRDATLIEILSEALPKKFEEAATMKCFAGNSEGKEISLDLKPHEVDYITDSLQHQTRPLLLLLCSESSDDGSDTFNDDNSFVPDRTASGMVQELLSIELPDSPETTSSFSCATPLSPPTPGLAFSESAIVASGAQEDSSCSMSNHLRFHTMNFVRRELYDIQNELVQLDTLATSSDDSDIPARPSSPQQVARFQGHPTSFGKKTKSEGYLTLQHTPVRKRPVFSLKRHSLFPTKANILNGESFTAAEGRKWQRTTAIRRKRKTSSVTSPPIPEASYTFQVRNVYIVTEDDISFEVPCSEYNTVAELKETVADCLNKQCSDRLKPWKPSDFILTYEVEGKEYELFNEWQFIYKTLLYDTWARLQADIPVKVCSVGELNETDLAMVLRISKLAGVVMDDSLRNADVISLRRIAVPDQREVQWARRTLHSFVDQISSSRDAEDYALSMEIDSSDTSTILALKIPIDTKIEITFHYKQCFSLKKRVSVQCFADSVLAEVFPCVKACGLVEGSVDSYVLQFSGEASYIAGKNELISFRDIRRCISKDEPIHLSLTEKMCFEDDQPCKLTWLTVDPYSAVPPLHTDITSSHDGSVQALSVWDREDTFTLRIIKAENLPLIQSKFQGPGAVVEATLYHGDKPLCPPVSTAVHALSHTVRWKETLSFKIVQKNIPKAAKVMVVIREPLQRRESLSARKVSRYIYWGLITVFDHQGMMHNGEKTLTLWRGSKDPHEEHFKPNPCGPASNNPDPKAVSLLIRFDTYSFPVYYPTSAPQSWSILLAQQSMKAPVRKQFQKLLELIKDGGLHSAVPAYIAKVNWGDLFESVEVYSLLDQIADARQSFPVETALKLLDCDFPDDNVREFATRVLEYLPDEQLEDFLLQLTQAIKFELNHDSSLARFLLKRALRNKRIGHFFFWYLKCEMYNPQYRTRFGVILEAYLKGCGESMLKHFEDQVKMQTKLEEIALELKLRHGDDPNKMQVALPEMLERRGIPGYTVTPVHNPRLTLGKLRPTKCKIMVSKKKPQWLEMYNVDCTALHQTPIRLILKLGDDLRQDMITLRMFSLFEKLWEHEGLDLSLIPYGCMATGPKTGFIEVVKNAKTIAEVSGVSNSTKLCEWIKSHQKNEFGEVDADKVKAAVKTFVHSCAGYSVATYVLGIGDRHNDNIMVTTSGNLFHIDFGHFLGNIKYCMGFKREWAPFVLTPDFVYTMGGEDSDTFETYKNLCCRAFLTLRRHADLIINLFSMMRSTGIPELTCVEDTEYIRNALVLNKSELEAEQMFRKVIKKCLDLKWTVQIMWKIHLLRKKGSS